MGQELGPIPFFQNSDSLIAQYSEQWSGGSLFAARVKERINTTVSTHNGSILGRVMTLPMRDVNSVPTYVVHEVQRGQGAVGAGEGVGTFIAFEACMLMLAWAMNVDGQGDFYLAIDAPTGYEWSRVRNLMSFTETVNIPVGNQPIAMPGRRF